MGKVEILGEINSSESGYLRFRETLASTLTTRGYDFPEQSISMEVTHFLNGEDEPYQIYSRREIRAILQDLARLGTQVFLYYGEGYDFIITTLLSADEDGIWLETGPYQDENRFILQSNKIMLVSTHRQVKVQFGLEHIVDTIYGEHAAFHAALPDHLLRIQRREFFRSDILNPNDAQCLIPLPLNNLEAQAAHLPVKIVNISSSGLQLLCESELDWVSHHALLQNCTLMLNGSEPLKVSLEVRNIIELPTLGSTLHRRIGCRFVDLDNYADFELQRQLNRLQQEALSQRWR